MLQHPRIPAAADIRVLSCRYWTEELSVDPFPALMKAFVMPGDINVLAWKFIGVFFAVSVTLMKLVPGAVVKGPVTPTGHVPQYIENGVSSFVGALTIHDSHRPVAFGCVVCVCVHVSVRGMRLRVHVSVGAPPVPVAEPPPPPARVRACCRSSTLPCS
jgi:hypothetical protein